MRLYFFRHGAAGAAESDFQRALTAKGAQVTRRAAQLLRALAVQPAHLYSSPRVRARQTADIVADVLGCAVEVDEGVNFDFDVRVVQRLIANLPADGHVMFVGHNPSMSAVVGALTGANISLKKSGIARIDLYPPETARGELVWLLTPKVYSAEAP